MHLRGKHRVNKPLGTAVVGIYMGINMSSLRKDQISDERRAAGHGY